MRDQQSNIRQLSGNPSEEFIEALLEPGDQDTMPHTIN